MITWILIAVGALLVLLIALRQVLKRGTLYIPTSFGYLSMRSGPEPRRQVSEAQYSAILPHLVEGKVLDFLAVSYLDDDYSGTAFFNDGAKIELSSQFEPGRDEEAVERFKSVMLEAGYGRPVDEYSNGGQCLTVMCAVPSEPEVLDRLTYVTLDALLGPLGGPLYVQAALIGDGPGHRLQFERHKDPLEALT